MRAVDTSVSRSRLDRLVNDYVEGFGVGKLHSEVLECSSLCLGRIITPNETGDYSDVVEESAAHNDVYFGKIEVQRSVTPVAQTIMSEQRADLNMRQS